MSQDRRLEEILDDAKFERNERDRIITKQAIIKLFKKCVPKSIRTGQEVGCVADEVEGWEKCRLKMLRRIEEVWK